VFEQFRIRELSSGEIFAPKVSAQIGGDGVGTLVIKEKMLEAVSGSDHARAARPCRARLGISAGTPLIVRARKNSSTSEARYRTFLPIFTNRKGYFLVHRQTISVPAVT
jgi:hypothetical protein